MAKLARKLLSLFGGSGATSNFLQFGSQTAGAPVNTKDILTIQALAAWVNGWQDAVYASNLAPFLEDMNSLHYVLAYQIAYGLQEGIPEYDATTTYFIGSLVKKTGTSEIYKSIIDTNLGNALPSKADNSSWQYVINKGILQYDSTYSYSIGEIVQKPGTAELYQSLTNSNVGNALPSQTSTAIWKYLVDLANLAPPPAGIQKIKFGFIPLTMTVNEAGSVNSSKNPAADFGFDSDMSVYAMCFITRTGLALSTASSAPFNFSLDLKAVLSGTGVDSSGGFLNGGAAGTTYTFTMTLTNVTSVGTGPVTCDSIAVFIGIK